MVPTPCRSFVSALHDWSNTSAAGLNVTVWVNNSDVGGGEEGGVHPPSVQRWSQPINLAGVCCGGMVSGVVSGGGMVSAGAALAGRLGCFGWMCSCCSCARAALLCPNPSLPTLFACARCAAPRLQPTPF